MIIMDYNLSKSCSVILILKGSSGFNCFSLDVSLVIIPQILLYLYSLIKISCFLTLYNLLYPEDDIFSPLWSHEYYFRFSIHRSWPFLKASVHDVWGYASLDSIKLTKFLFNRKMKVLLIIFLVIQLQAVLSLTRVYDIKVSLVTPRTITECLNNS